MSRRHARFLTSALAMFNIQRRFLAGPTGIEPAAYGLRVRRSNLTELRAHVFSLGRKHGLGDIELAVSCSMPVGFLFCDMSAGLRYGLFNMVFRVFQAKNTLPPSP